MWAEERERVADEQEVSIEEGGLRGYGVADAGDEGLGGFFHEFSEGPGEDGFGEGFLLGPDFGAHFSRGERIVVVMAVAVGHDGGVFGS